MKILKFGGSSVATPERVNSVVNILKEYFLKKEKFAVVFSAFGGVTDSLIEMTKLAESADDKYLTLFEKFRSRHLDAVEQLIVNKEKEEVLRLLKENHDDLKKLLYGIFLIGEATKRTMDHVLSFGERNSAFIIAGACRKAGINAVYCDARKLIKTDKNFGRAKVNHPVTARNIESHFVDNQDIQIITGFIGSSNGRCTTTLGRGGSDFTASLFGAALNATEIEIWTDVDGVMTANPQIVKDAFSIPTMTYAEAMEISHFGAKVIYPPTIQPALDKEIPIFIKNTFNPGFPGTLISNKKDKRKHIVKSISSIGNVALLTVEGSGMFGIPGIAGRVFGILAAHEINIILITQASSEHSITFAVGPNDASLAKSVIEKEFELELSRGVVDSVKVERELTLLAVVGENMRYRKGIAGLTFRALGKSDVNIVAIAQGSSELNISIAIKKEDEEKALISLHNAFFRKRKNTVFVFIVGVGLVGKTLIRQILEHKLKILEKLGIEIVIAGIASSKKMIFSKEGIDSEFEKLLQVGEMMDMDKFIEKMNAYNGNNKIFIDNTASEDVVNAYEQILRDGISISTPNKKAMSGDLKLYRKLKTIERKRKVFFKYETNVGAGLPVVTTISDLVNSGDEIISIEGVLSGSLSFIFNNYVEDVSFSKIVEKAKQLGFTEPDPRDDLSGTDVKRKILILAREAGFQIEENEIEIENILPDSCLRAKTVDLFFKELEKNNGYFKNLAIRAEEQNGKLRFIANFENGKGNIGLKIVEKDSPFYQLNGSDNMVVIKSKRYFDRPLVIQGPGAGAEVTAGGVFSEIMRISSSLIKK